MLLNVDVDEYMPINSTNIRGAIKIYSVNLFPRKLSKSAETKRMEII